jgi:GNAT superfamily N-acetyltransferase
MYQWVGRNWYWRERLVWSDEQWTGYMANENTRMWVTYIQGSIAGYFELMRQDEEAVEIGYFGLLPECIGKGYGGYMLTEAIRLAWDWGRNVSGCIPAHLITKMHCPIILPAA